MIPHIVIIVDLSLNNLYKDLGIEIKNEVIPTSFHALVDNIVLM